MLEHPVGCPSLERVSRRERYIRWRFFMLSCERHDTLDATISIVQLKSS